MNAPEVIKTILEKEGLSMYALSTKIGKTQAHIRDITTGRIKNLSTSFACAINKAFPHYNLEWLLGNSDVIESNLQCNIVNNTTEFEFESIKEEELKEVITSSGRMIPVNIARTPNVELESNIEKLQVPYKYPTDYMPKYEFMYRVLSNAMEPALYTGDIIFIQRSYDKRVLNGDCYLLDTVPLGIILRKVVDKGDTIECIAINNDSESFILSKDELFDVYTIVAILRFNANIQSNDSNSIRKELSKRDSQIDGLIEGLNKLIDINQQLIKQLVKQ